eukprot:8483728-Pyramimonas_sp.AAC.1
MAEYTGRRDQRDEQHFQTVIGNRFGMVDMYQGESTHASASSRSRLDRIYANYHMAEQLDRHIRCTALEWRRDLSHHWAVYFARRSPQPVDDAGRPLSSRALSDPSFPRRAALAYQEARRGHPDATALERLKLSKTVLRLVATRLDRERGAPPPAASLEDRLGCALKFIRAAEAGHIEQIS